jgi:predicted transposase/invertase (TIGR01784 family)
MGIYANPMKDAVAKLLLKDDEIRNGCLSTFSGIEIEESVELDSFCNPFDIWEMLRSDLSTFDLVHYNLFQKNKEFILIDKANGKEFKQGSDLFYLTVKHLKDLQHLFPKYSTQTSVDFICQTTAGELVTIEFQIEREDSFEARAVYYMSSLFAKQKMSTNLYEHLCPVIAINLLGGKRNFEWKNQNMIRHFELKDRYSDTKLPHLQLIQYALGKNFDIFDFKDIKTLNKEKLKEWLSFFENAHHLDKKIDVSFDDIKKAYEIVRIDHLRETNPHILIENYGKYSKHMTALEEEARKEGGQQMLLKIVKKLLDQNKTDNEICEFAEIDLEKLKEMKKEMQYLKIIKKG